MSRKLALFLFKTIFAIAAIFSIGFFLPPTASAIDTAREAELQAQLAAKQAEIDKVSAEINNLQDVSASFERDIALLQAQINQAKLKIDAKNLQISQLTKGIGEKNDTIGQLTEKTADSKRALAQLIREQNIVESNSLPSVILSAKSLSDFFNDVYVFTTLNESLTKLVADIRDAQAKTEVAKQDLSNQLDAVTDAKYAIVQEQNAIKAKTAEVAKLLLLNKQKTVSYATVLSQRQKEAAAIRTALFQLRDAGGIQFEEALRYANEASAKTGVRAALILAILTQESDLGKNQGSCLVTDISTGNGVGKNSGTPFEKVMKAPRDTAPFQSITSRLGRSWSSTPVSCPFGYVYTSSRGYGGGMGPSQFIPSTWELFKARIGKNFGIGADQADPWNPEHAIMATAIYMADLGAKNGTYTAERNAACKYYSGAACSATRKPPNASYGDGVMSKVSAIQANIDAISGI